MAQPLETPGNTLGGPLEKDIVHWICPDCHLKNSIGRSAFFGCTGCLHCPYRGKKGILDVLTKDSATEISRITDIAWLKIQGVTAKRDDLVEKAAVIRYRIKLLGTERSDLATERDFDIEEIKDDLLETLVDVLENNLGLEDSKVFKGRSKAIIKGGGGPKHSKKVRKSPPAMMDNDDNNDNDDNGNNAVENEEEKSFADAVKGGNDNAVKRGNKSTAAKPSPRPRPGNRRRSFGSDRKPKNNIFTITQQEIDEGVIGKRLEGRAGWYRKGGIFRIEYMWKNIIRSAFAHFDNIRKIQASDEDIANRCCDGAVPDWHVPATDYCSLRVVFVLQAGGYDGDRRTAVDVAWIDGKADAKDEANWMAFRHGFMRCVNHGGVKLR